MASIKHNGLGGLGGLLFLGTRAIPIDMPPLVRGIGLGFGGSVLLAMLTKSTHMAAGMAGASVYYLGEKDIAPLAPGLLHDDFDLQDNAEWVDADTLEDSGYEDENGNSIVMDEDGIMYALNDRDELVAIDDNFDLQDEVVDLQTLNMVPLEGPDYSLSRMR